MRLEKEDVMKKMQYILNMMLGSKEFVKTL